MSRDIPGVNYDRKARVWRATLGKDGSFYHVGGFHTKAEAAAARAKAMREGVEGLIARRSVIRLPEPPFAIPPAKPEPTHAARLSVSALSKREARELERDALRTLPVFPTIADGVLAEDWT